MKKFLKIIFLIFILIFRNYAEDKKYCKVVIDTEGRKVYIKNAPQRVVVLTAVCLETIYIFGKIQKVKGVSKSVFNNPVYKEIIEELENIPIVASTENEVDIEKLLSVRADLVIGLGYSHPSGLSKETVKRIEGFGIPVVLIDIKNLNQNYYTISLLGEIFESKDKANNLISYMKSIVKLVQKEVKKIPEKKKRKVLLISGDKPTYVAGNYWGEQDIRRLAGGIPTPEDIKQFFSILPLEKIISLNPDVILISHLATYSEEDILNNPQWKNISAVKHKRVYKNPYQIGGIYTPRVVLLLAWTAKKIYPELNIDWVNISDDFFKKFYGIGYYGEKE